MRLPVPGWYGSARPNSYAVLVRDSHIETSHGTVGLPGQGVNVLFLDHAIYKGQMILAGQSHGGEAGCWLKKGDHPWKIVGGAHGIEMVRFSDDGRFLFVVDSNDTGYWIDLETDFKASFVTAFGVNGIRSVHGPNRTMQTGVATTFDSVRNVSKYTTLDNGLVIGQGRVVGGIIAIRGNDRRIIEQGDCDWYKVCQVGTSLALAATKEEEGVCVLHTLQLSELDSLPVEPVTAPTDPIVAIGREMYVIWYEFAEPPTLPPGNAMLRITEGGLMRTFDGKPIASYAQGHPDSDVDALDRAIVTAKAANPGLPVLAYWTRQAQGIRLPAGADWIGVEAYRGVSEPLDVFEARVRTAVARCPCPALICQCYTSNPGNTTDLASLVPVYARISRDVPSIIANVPFSDFGRATGLNQNPAVRPLWQQLANGVTGLPGGQPVAIDFARANQLAVQYWAELRVSERSRAIRDGFQRGDHVVGTNPNDPNEPWSASKMGDHEAYSQIQHLQAEAFKEIMGRLYWNDHILLEMFYKNGPAGPPGEDIAIHRLSPTSVEYKDTVWALGHEAATPPDFNPPYKSPSDPAHVGMCAPPPRPAGPEPEPQPGLFGVTVHRFTNPMHRSNPEGSEVVYEIGSTRPIVRVEISLDSGEPPYIAEYPPPYPPDGRYWRGIRFKPVINSPAEGWTLLIKAKDDQGNWGQSNGSHKVVVVP